MFWIFLNIFQVVQAAIAGQETLKASHFMLEPMDGGDSCL